MPNHISGTQQYKCRDCGKVLNSDSDLREHEKAHKGQSQQGSQGTGTSRQAGDRSAGDRS
jgi:hypothetical protein